MPRINMEIAFGSNPPPMIGKPKKVTHNTYRWRRPDGIDVIRFHQTDIVEIMGEGRYWLNTAGWQTSTTKDRINSQIAPYHIFSNKGLWYVSKRGADEPAVPFFDGMIIPDALRNGSTATEIGKNNRLLARQICNFVKKVSEVETLPLPDNGDCWYCMMFHAEKPNDPNKRGSMGHARDNGQSEQTGDHSHLLEHIKEGYLHGSLIVNALRWAGYTDTSIGYYLHDKDRRRVSVKSALRRYLRRKLGLPT